MDFNSSTLPDLPSDSSGDVIVLTQTPATGNGPLKPDCMENTIEENVIANGSGMLSDSSSDIVVVAHRPALNLVRSDSNIQEDELTQSVPTDSSADVVVLTVTPAVNNGLMNTDCVEEKVDEDALTEHLPSDTSDNDVVLTQQPSVPDCDVTASVESHSSSNTNYAAEFAVCAEKTSEEDVLSPTLFSSTQEQSDQLQCQESSLSDDTQNCDFSDSENIQTGPSSKVNVSPSAQNSSAAEREMSDNQLFSDQLSAVPSEERESVAALQIDSHVNEKRPIAVEEDNSSHTVQSPHLAVSIRRASVKRPIESQSSDSDNEERLRRKKKVKKYRKTSDPRKIKSSTKPTDTSDTLARRQDDASSPSTPEENNSEPSNSLLEETVQRPVKKTWRRAQLSEEAKARVRGIARKVFPDLYKDVPQTANEKRLARRTDKKKLHNIRCEDEWIADILLDSDSDDDKNAKSNHVDMTSSKAADGKKEKILLDSDSDDDKNANSNHVDMTSSKAADGKKEKDVYSFAEDTDEESRQISLAQQRSMRDYTSLRPRDHCITSAAAPTDCGPMRNRATAVECLGLQNEHRGNTTRPADSSSHEDESGSARSSPLKLTLIRTGSQYRVRNDRGVNYSNPALSSALGPLDNPYRSTGWVKRRCGRSEDWFKSPHVDSNPTVGPCAPDSNWGTVSEKQSTDEEDIQMHENNDPDESDDRDKPDDADTDHDEPEQPDDDDTDRDGPDDDDTDPGEVSPGKCDFLLNF